MNAAFGIYRDNLFNETNIIVTNSIQIKKQQLAPLGQFRLICSIPISMDTRDKHAAFAPSRGKL